MKRLFLSTANGNVDMKEGYETLEDVQAKYHSPMFKAWEEQNMFFIKVITTHNERKEMKGRGNDGWCY